MDAAPANITAFDDTLMLPCGTCGARNPTRGQDLPTTRPCATCHAEMAPLSTPLDVDAGELIAVVSSARVPVLIDFWAPWCPPCRLAGPIVKKVAADMAGRALVLKVDTNRHPELAAEFGVRAIPTFVVIKNRKVVLQHAGLARPARMKRWLSENSTTKEQSR